MLGIKWCGPARDSSGYAQFSRSFLGAIDKYSPDTNLTLQLMKFEQATPDLGEFRNVVKSLENKVTEYQVKINNLTPNFMPMVKEKNCKNVFFTMFETSRIPNSWVQDLNEHCDAVMVPSIWNKEVFLSSGVKKPIYVVAPGIDVKEDIDKATLPTLSNLPDKCITFYSIFQWTERKFPDGLIKAFLAAFDGVPDVYLVLKTYGSDQSTNQQEKVKGFIQRIKANLRLVNPPKILFIGDLLTNEEITAIHKRCDCFVLPHRAEGWGMPHMEAMAHGKPVITTGFSGNMDFCNDKNSYLLDYQMTIVSNMPWIAFYEADMEWAEPDLSQLKYYMRHVYEQIKTGNDSEMKTMAALAKQNLVENFNWKKSAETIVNACKEIVNG